jgi:hypothetical protein
LLNLLISKEVVSLLHKLRVVGGEPFSFGFGYDQVDIASLWTPLERAETIWQTSSLQSRSVLEWYRWCTWAEDIVTSHDSGYRRLRFGAEFLEPTASKDGKAIIWSLHTHDNLYIDRNGNPAITGAAGPRPPIATPAETLLDWLVFVLSRSRFYPQVEFCSFRGVWVLRGYESAEPLPLVIAADGLPLNYLDNGGDFDAMKWDIKNSLTPDLIEPSPLIETFREWLDQTKYPPLIL